MSRARYLLSAPTGGEIDMSLSFRITSRSTSMSPALLSASKAMPAVIAPSPMTATAWRFSPFSLDATAMPSAALIEVLECAVPNVSYSLSSRRGKPGDAAPHPQLLHGVAPAGQHLVAVGLVADVPHDAVVRRVEHVMQRDRQLDRAEVRRKMASGLAHRFEQELAQLVREPRQLAFLELAQLRADR